MGKNTSNSRLGGDPSEHIIRFVARNYYKRNRSEVKILDFGCGVGANTWYLAREGFDTYAFDISESAIKKLNARMEAEGLTVQSFVADGLTLPYNNNTFDAIIDSASIFSNPIADIMKMYRKCYALLVDGGKFMTVVFTRETTGYGTGREVEPGSYDEIQEGPLQSFGIRHFFEADEFRNCLQEAGFENISIEKSFYTDNGNIVSQLLGFCEK